MIQRTDTSTDGHSRTRHGGDWRAGHHCGEQENVFARSWARAESWHVHGKEVLRGG
jgi:hypothetical protein